MTETKELQGKRLFWIDCKWIFFALVICACRENSSQNNDTDTETDIDTDTGTVLNDSDSETDTNSDTETDSDTDTSTIACPTDYPDFECDSPLTICLVLPELPCPYDEMVCCYRNNTVPLACPIDNSIFDGYTAYCSEENSDCGEDFALPTFPCENEEQACCLKIAD